MTKDHYETLGVDKDASDQDIKNAYRKKAKQEHPDTGGDPERFNALTIAYETLKDEDARAEYDRTGKSKGQQPDNDKAVALSLIDGLMQQALQEDGAIHVDVIDAVRGGINQEIQNIRKAISKLEAEAQKTEKFAGRLLGAGPVRAMLENRKSEYERQATGLKDKIRLAELALDLIKDEVFQPEPRQEPTYSSLTREMMEQQLRQAHRTATSSFFHGRGGL